MEIITRKIAFSLQTFLQRESVIVVRGIVVVSGNIGRCYYQSEVSIHRAGPVSKFAKTTIHRAGPVSGVCGTRVR